MSKGFSNLANTCVFWDVEDCPIRDGDDPDSVYQNIKSALANEGYRGTVDIWAYCEKNSSRTCVRAGIHVIPEGDKCARRYRMMSDLLFWALDNPSEDPVKQPNVMVISENISEDAEFIHVLQILQWRSYNVLFAESYHNVASIKEHDFVTSVWLWTNLLAGGNPSFQSGSPLSVDNNHKRTTSIPSGSSKDAANKRQRKNRGDSGGM